MAKLKILEIAPEINACRIVEAVLIDLERKIKITEIEEQEKKINWTGQKLKIMAQINQYILEQIHDQMALC